MLITMQTAATTLTARPIAGPIPLANPTAGRTNGNTRYISTQRTAATMIDVWNALRAPSAVPRGPSNGSRSKRRMNRSAFERCGSAGAAALSSVVSATSAIRQRGYGIAAAST